jgi:hypothetical protein
MRLIDRTLEGPVGIRVRLREQAGWALLLGAEVAVQPGLAHAQILGQPADRHPLEPSLAPASQATIEQGSRRSNMDVVDASAW